MMDKCDLEQSAVRHWCILRTRAANTLALAESLGRAGYTAWTPIEVKVKRIGRRRERVERSAPIMPTYVFAQAARIDDLLALSAAPAKDHADFSVFHHRDRIPLVADDTLKALRDFEAKLSWRRLKRQPAARPLPVGITVRVPSGVFGGLSGVVEESDGRYTLVCFGRFGVKIDTFLLRSNDLENGKSGKGPAA